MKSKDKKENLVREVNLVTMRMKGHCARSGYDRLIDYMQARQIEPPKKLSFIDRLIARCYSEITNGSGSIWYHRIHFLTELRAAKQWLRSKGQIFHFIYGENSYQHLAKLKKIRPGNKIVCTYHVPPEKFKIIIKNNRMLRDLDGIIVLSNFQKDFFINLLGHQNVWFVPHGIDIDFFKPGSGMKFKNGKFNCIFVGRHMRDINTMKMVIEIFEHRDQSVVFHIVSKPEINEHFKPHSNVNLYSNIPDQELLEMYRSADALTLPLIDGTANNTILEAIACGLPVITTDLPATRDYLSGDCALFVEPGNAEGFAENIKKLKDKAYRKKMADNSRRQALEFDWRRIAEKLMACYNEIV